MKNVVRAYINLFGLEALLTDVGTGIGDAADGIAPPYQRMYIDAATRMFEARNQVRVAERGEHPNG